MGILLLGGALGFVSSRSVFFIATAVVAITAITALMIKHHSDRKRGMGGRNSLMDHQRHMKFQNRLSGYQAFAMASYNDETDINNLRTQIVNSISANTDDITMFHNSMPQVMSDINRDAQRGGPLWQTIQDRRNGHIDATNFHDRVGNYVRQLCSNHHIRIRPHHHGQVHRYGNPDYNDYIKKLLAGLHRKKGFQMHYPYGTPIHSIPIPPPVHTAIFPAYPKPYQAFGDYTQPEPGLCNPTQRYNYCLNRCVPYDNPIPDTCKPPLGGTVYGTY